MFADRTGWDLTPNRLEESLRRLREAGAEILDLTESNPTAVGIRYPEGLLESIAHPRGLLYRPEPKGLLRAREAVAAAYAAKGSPLDPERICLTASTSEGCSYLFRLLADPQEEILVPKPSYPLFDYLADLNDVRAVPYRLQLTSQGEWSLDVASIRRAITPRTRAWVVVHPNNPTGSCLRRDELEQALLLCRRHDLALIADEVFAEYLWREEPQAPRTLLGSEGTLVFALGGLSKFMGLPQMKVAWIAASGPEGKLSEALARLEMIADTYLSVNTAVQEALPGWMESAAPIQGQIRRRLLENRRTLEAVCATGKIRPLPSQGGWSAVLRLPGVEDEERWAADLLGERRVRIHPGYLFGFEGSASPSGLRSSSSSLLWSFEEAEKSRSEALAEEGAGFAVISLLPQPEIFSRGIRELVAFR